jgi:hypothetical protein
MSPAARKPRPRRQVALLLLLGVATLGTARGAGAETSPSITATALPGEIPIGASVTVTGLLAGEPAAVAARPLQLEAAPYPYRSYGVIARTQSAADGTFSFPASSPRSNLRVRVSISGVPGTVSPVVHVTVDPRVAIHARSLGPGREHTDAPRARSSSVFWYLALRHSTRFTLAAFTRSREIAPGVTYASVIVNPPATRFSYRVCLNPGWEAAMGPASSHGSCPAHSFRLKSAN